MAGEDVWKHRDGSKHATNGPLGCPECANLRRLAIHNRDKPCACLDCKWIRARHNKVLQP